MTFSYHQRLILVAGGLLGCFLIIFAGVTYLRTKSYVEQETREKQMSIMRALKNDMNGWMAPSMRIITALSQELGGKEFFEQKTVVPLLARAKKAIGSAQVYFGLEDGRMMYDSGKELDPNWYKPKERPWYRQGLDSNKTILSTPFVGFASNQLTLTIMSPVFVHGEKKGVVAASFYINKLYRKIKSITFERGYAYVVDHEGKIVLHPDKSMHGLNLNTQNAELKRFFELMRTQKEGYFEYQNGEDKELLSFGRLHNGWFTIVAIKKSIAMAFADRMLMFFSIMGSLMLLLGVAILTKIAPPSISSDTISLS